MKNKGFSLIELLVSIAIFGILSTFIVANIRGSGPKQEVRLQAANLASLLRQAQVRSMAGEPVEGSVPLGGYGLEIDDCVTAPCSVTTLVDRDGDFAADSTDQIGLGDQILTDVVGADSVRIYFKPPRPYVCINADCSRTQEVVINVLHPRTDDFSTVKVNPVSGQIGSQ